jgi:hypothetical protein
LDESAAAEFILLAGDLVYGLTLLMGQAPFSLVIRRC